MNGAGGRALSILTAVALLALLVGYWVTGKPGIAIVSSAASPPAPVLASPPVEPGSTPSPTAAPQPSTGPVTPPPAAGDAPNIVFFLVDDLAMFDGRLWERLPTMQRLFQEEGVRFTNFHVESPLCCPSRAGFLTGQHTFNHGAALNDARLLDPSMTLATQLQGIGYHTFMTGKYLNGYRYIAPQKPPGWNDFIAMSEGAYYNYALFDNGGPRVEAHLNRPADYSTDVLARHAVQAIRDAPIDRPVFGLVAPFAPHQPTLPSPRDRRNRTCDSIPRWAPPNYNERDVSDKPEYIRQTPRLSAPPHDIRDICRSMLAVDRMVADVVEELERSGRLDNTLLLFGSDNGMNFGAHRLGKKSTPYSTEVFFRIWWPDRLGTSPDPVTDRIQNIDVAPTICELVGCELGPYPNGQADPDGLSFAPLLVGNASALDRDAVLESMPVRTWAPAWHAVATTAASPLASKGCELARGGACRWHYVEYETGERELYDVSFGPCWDWDASLPGDPCELENRAGDPALREVEAALRARLAELMLEGPRVGGTGPGSGEPLGLRRLEELDRPARLAAVPAPEWGSRGVRLHH